MRNSLLAVVFSIFSLLLASCEKSYYVDDDPTDDTEQNENTGGGQGEDAGDEGQTDEGGFTIGDYVDVETFVNNEISVQVWVSGYIVGAATGAHNSIRYDYEPPFAYDTALLLSDSPQPADGDAVISVCLTSCSKSIREKLNLVNHPENKGRRIEIFGFRETYLKLPGVKHIDGYNFPVG